MQVLSEGPAGPVADAQWGAEQAGTLGASWCGLPIPSTSGLPEQFLLYSWVHGHQQNYNEGVQAYSEAPCSSPQAPLKNQRLICDFSGP